MEKLLNPHDKESMKMAMLKHEEAFREQVYELHRLYRIQKILMKDTTKRNGNGSGYNQPETGVHFNLERPADQEFNRAESNDQDDILELTLGSRSYNYQRKTKADIEPGRPSDFGSSFSSSSSGSSNNTKRTREELLSQQKWGLEMPAVSNQDRINNPPWLFQALSLNMT